MRAVVCRDGELKTTEVPDPVPGPGQILLEVRRCGICGSDLHARHSADDLAGVLAEIGYDDYMRAADPVVMGHEFSGVVLDSGTGAKPRPGTPVVALPLVRHGGELHAVGLSRKAPGGYAEQVVVQAALTLPVPNGLSLDIAALTEPMAVAWHAVNRGEVRRQDVAVVLGCGPVGLAVILVLKARGVATVVASDPSPGRRILALACGADAVVDPGEHDPFAGAPGYGHLTTMQAPIGAALDAVTGLGRLPVPWWHSWRILEKLGKTAPKAPVVFECVGIPGMLERVLTGAPLYSRVVVVGVCMGADTLRPAMALNKQLELRFVVGYTPLEFRDTLHALATGRLDPAPLLTGRVGLDGVPAAFDTLANPGTHAKVLVDPALAGTAIARA
ncbi:zinc-binding dehydrogenase [Dactylosporangium sp. CS-033363]|uniref:zinc-binding dehydrogenase n=1 Tax=Dactylosporangium sp. CS-033363 TaxID=3239935 RepID=UPI003D8A0836